MSTQEDVVAAVLAGLGKAVPFEAGPASSSASSSSSSSTPSEALASGSDVQPPANKRTAEEIHHQSSNDGAVARSSSPGTTATTTTSSAAGSLPVEPRVVQFVTISKSRQDRTCEAWLLLLRWLMLAVS
jgi:hypothetical protein